MQGGGRLRAELQDECLKQEIFYSLKEAQTVIGLWQNTYNRVRPHSSLGYRPPRLSPSRIWPSGYPWPRPCSSLAIARSKIPVRSTQEIVRKVSQAAMGTGEVTSNIAGVAGAAGDWGRRRAGAGLSFRTVASVRAPQK